MRFPSIYRHSVLLGNVTSNRMSHAHTSFHFLSALHIYVGFTRAQSSVTLCMTREMTEAYWLGSVISDDLLGLPLKTFFTDYKKEEVLNLIVFLVCISLKLLILHYL